LELICAKMEIGADRLTREIPLDSGVRQYGNSVVLEINSPE
jgi:hypothetical protein